MKQLKITFLFTFSIIIILCTVDIFIFRGYFISFTQNSIYKDYSYNTNDTDYQINNPDFTFNVIKDTNNTFHLKLKNNSIKPYWFWTFRWDKVLLNDERANVIEHFRVFKKLPKSKDTLNYFFDCGSGLGDVIITPFEKREKKILFKDFLCFNSFRNLHKETQKKDTIKDLIYNKPLFVKTRDTIYYLKNNPVTEKDSIDILFYIPIFSFKDRKLSYVKSNFVKVPYQEIVDRFYEYETKLNDIFN